ncbi:MAG: glycoside hydrolase family 13 protein [Bacteroidia bacterium]|nr:glycoside hydrolase family 13 protein [Bacteroidia bacterium]
MLNRNYLLCFLFVYATHPFLKAQDKDIVRIDPPYWFTMMSNTKMQLCMYGPKLSQYEVSAQYEGVVIDKVNKVENVNYLFVDLDISLSTKPGVINFQFTKGKKKFSYPYELRSRTVAKNRAAGVTASDFIYLTMPDRFANGDTTNDVVPGMQEKAVNRDSLTYRHGGDLMGIIKNMPYLKFSGFTALWLTPVQENDQLRESYHGYAITDHYKIDRRLGTNENYEQLVTVAHSIGLKVIMDVVLNHVGDRHWFIQDLPSKDWIHQWPTYTRTTYKDGTLMDPYAADADKKRMTDGWFDTHMPDLNQKNPFVANYLLQNYLWWIETTGIDGFRIDTYAYADQDFARKWVNYIKASYPNFSFFAETWVHGVTNQSFFAKNIYNKAGYQGTVPGVTDFQLYYAINDALNQKFGWTEGVNRLYHTLCSDWVYQNPMQNVVFLDNHDLSRFYSVVGKDIKKWKMGITFLLTTRGIPMLYYGTELLMHNFSNDGSSNVRDDFPGGWPNDTINKFLPQGRNESEKEAHNFISKLALWRQYRPAIQNGKLMQFVPEDGVYVYFRYDDKATIMMVMNANEKAITLNTKRFAERVGSYTKGYEVISNKTLNQIENIEVEAMSAQIIELK